MKALCLILLILSGCASPPVAVPTEAGKQANDCLPSAIEMVQGLKGAGIKAEVVSMDFVNSNMGHAIAAYIYPTGSNQLWVWDKANGSMRVHAYFNDPPAIAKAYAFKTASDFVKQAQIIE